MGENHPINRPTQEIAVLRSFTESVFQRIADSLATLDLSSDPVFRELAIRRASAFDEDIRRVAAGTFVFANTETWHAAYERVLRSLGSSSEYRSASWVKSEAYWASLPGLQSMKLNYELLDGGLRIERVLILGWNLWPPEERLPASRMRQLIEDQHFRGISISLVRENDLASEGDLLRDFGVYGDRATGEQETDGESRTVRFALCFDHASIRLAQDRWERLRLFARPYGEILDHGLSVV